MVATFVGMAGKRRDESESVRISRALAKKARVVAAALDMSMPEYIDSRLMAIVDKDLREVVGVFVEEETQPKDERRRR